MAAKAILMEQLKQILRLQRDGFSINAIVRHTGISWPTIKKYLTRIENAVNSMPSLQIFAGDVSDGLVRMGCGTRRQSVMAFVRSISSSSIKFITVYAACSPHR
jgi:hypothetical protein